MKAPQEEVVQLNLKQAEFLSSTQRVRVFLGGRGSGKSFTIGVSILMKAIELPFSCGAWASTTYTQMRSKMITSLKKAWKSYGLIQDVHYVIGKKPPKEWPKPYNEVENYTNMITFYWGSCCELLSLERADNVRGGSFDYLEIDEAALLEELDYKKIVRPCVRGNIDKYTSPYHQQISFYTSIPRDPKGYWLLDFEKKAQLEPHKYLWHEATAYDNIHILGEQGIEDLREDLNKGEFDIEVMNKRNKKGQFAFYDKFDAEIHTYKSNSYTGERKDIDVNKELSGSIDIGGHINFFTVWQQSGNLERCVGEVIKQGSNSLKSLISEFCETYDNQVNKRIRIWGEPRGWNAEPNSPPLYEVIRQYFKDLGWIAIIETPRGYRTEKHETRQEVMNAVFEGGRLDLPTVLINEDECPYTILSIEQTIVGHDGKKVKTGEKNASLDQRKQPHGGDTVDYYIYFKYVIKPNKKKRKGGRGSLDIETL